MDSSFLTGIHIILGLQACFLFFKMLIQFGLPNHPARFGAYVVGLCITLYFFGLALTDLNLFPALVWMKWRALPLIAGSLCLLLQTIMLVGRFSLVQQKIISRMPLMAALLCSAFFSQYADHLAVFFLFFGCAFLVILVKAARYEKRLYLKMGLMLLLSVILVQGHTQIAYLISQLFLLLMVFYAFLFEHSYCVAALMDELKQDLEGDSR